METRGKQQEAQQQQINWDSALALHRKKQRKTTFHYFLAGCAEGAAAGGVFTLCTAGFGFFAIPVFALARGLHKALHCYYFYNVTFEKAYDANNTKRINLLSNLFLSAGLGAGIGATIGLFLAPFTFGLSIPVCAGIGALVGVADAGINYWQNKRLLAANREENLNSGLDAYEHARMGALAGAAIGLALAPFTAGISLPVCALVGAVFGAVGAYFIRKYVPSLTNRSSAKTKNLSVSAGASAGALTGAGFGIWLAAPTAGLSIPVCALLGAFVGAVMAYSASPVIERKLFCASQSEYQQNNTGVSTIKGSANEIMLRLSQDDDDELDHSSLQLNGEGGALLKPTQPKPKGAPTWTKCCLWSPTDDAVPSRGENRKFYKKPAKNLGRPNG